MPWKNSLYLLSVMTGPEKGQDTIDEFPSWPNTFVNVIEFAQNILKSFLGKMT